MVTGRRAQTNASSGEGMRQREARKPDMVFAGRCGLPVDLDQAGSDDLPGLFSA
jgi:hypothetical protein